MWLLGTVLAVSINVPVTIWCLVGGRKASAFHSTGLARRQFTLLKLCSNSALSQMSYPLFDDVTGDHVKNRRNRQRLPCTDLQCLLQLALSPPVFRRGLLSSSLALLFLSPFFSPLSGKADRPYIGVGGPRSPVPGSPGPRFAILRTSSGGTIVILNAMETSLLPPSTNHNIVKSKRQNKHT